MDSGKSIYGKGIFVASCICLAISTAIVTFTPKANGYERSIYAAYPLVAWIMLGFAFIGGLLLILWSASSDQRYGKHGLIIILGAYSIFYALPVMRGYVLFGTPRSDNLYHLGVVKDITRTGQVPEIIYPSTHILISQLVQITGLSRTLFQPMLAFLFSTVMLSLGMYSSTRRLTSDRSAGLFALAASVPLMYVTYHVVILPWFFTLCFFPIVIFLAQTWLESGDAGAYVLLMATAASIVFYHPLMAIFIAIGVMVYNTHAFFALSSRFSGENVRILNKSLVPLVMVIILAERNLGLTSMQTKIRTVGSYYFVQGTERGISASQAAESSYTLLQLVWQYMVLSWGPPLLYLITSGLIVLWIIYRLRNRQATGMEQVFVGQYIVGIGIGGLSYLFLFMTNPIRVFQYALLFSIYLIGIGVWVLIDRLEPPSGFFRTLAIALVLGAIVSSTIFSVGIAYDRDMHLTESTTEGTEWHLDQHRSNMQTYSLGMSRNLEYYYYGLSEGKNKNPTFLRHYDTRYIPQHIGYDNNSAAAETFNNESYVITKEEDIKRYQDVPKNRLSEVRYYDKSDRSRLDRDSTVDSIYTNGNFTVWFVERGNSSEVI